MIIEPDIPNMSEVTLTKITYHWKHNEMYHTLEATEPPYIMELDIGDHQMTTPVEVKYHMSNGVHTMYVQPNDTSHENFKSNDASLGAMTTYPKVTLIDSGNLVKVVGKSIDYVGDSKSIPMLTAVDSNNVEIASNYNSLFLYDLKPTKLYIVRTTSHFMGDPDHYNQEPAEYPIVRYVKDVSDNYLMSYDSTMENGDNSVSYTFHKELIEIESASGTINGVSVGSHITITGGEVVFTFHDNVAIGDDVIIKFDLKVFKAGGSNTIEVVKHINVGGVPEW